MRMNVLKQGELEPDTIYYKLYDDGSVGIDYRPHPHMNLHRLFLTATQVSRLQRAIETTRPAAGTVRHHGAPLPDVTRC
jgi:hypothetical protein